MRQTSTAVVSVALALAAIAAWTAGAEAAPRHHYHHHYRHLPRVSRNSVVYGADQAPLTVNKRSWLDPGNAVPVGAESAYVQEGTFFRRTPDQTQFPSRFHEDVMPRPLYVPGGDMTPVVTFATPGAPN